MNLKNWWNTERTGRAEAGTSQDFCTPRTSGRPPEKSTHLPTQIAMLPTPQTQGLKTCDEKGKTQFFKMPLLPTPTDSMVTMQDMIQAKFHSSKRPKYAGVKTGMKLQPAFVEWMMGFPIGWTDLNHSETP